MCVCVCARARGCCRSTDRPTDRSCGELPLLDSTLDTPTVFIPGAAAAAAAAVVAAVAAVAAAAAADAADAAAC